MSKQDAWEFYQDSANEWRWRRTATTNGELVGASTEGYDNKTDAEDNAARQGYSLDTWEFYTDSAGENRWRRTAVNGEIVGAAHEGYVNEADCLENAKRHGYDGILS